MASLGSSLVRSLHGHGRTLLVASTADIASINIAKSLLSHTDIWKNFTATIAAATTTTATIASANVTTSPSTSTESTVTGVFKAKNVHNEDVFMWIQSRSLLELDEPHELLLASEEGRHISAGTGTGTGLEEDVFFQEVIFLSRHSAASGVKSLTVHPIGIPWLTSSQKGRYGGRAGQCSPPSRRISPLYRELLRVSQAWRLSQTEEDCKEISSAPNASHIYDITLEATHHGPSCSLPCCFVEIGSDASTWGDAMAGDIWANVLIQNLCLSAYAHADTETDTATDVIEGRNADGDHGTAVVFIGGSHYVPKSNDVARLGQGIHIGHMIPSYAIQPLLYSRSPVSDELAPLIGEHVPTWKSVIKEAVASTRISFPSADIVVYLDKKIFKKIAAGDGAGAGAGAEAEAGEEMRRQVVEYITGITETEADRNGDLREEKGLGVVACTESFADLKRVQEAYVAVPRAKEAVQNTCRTL